MGLHPSFVAAALTHGGLFLCAFHGLWIGSSHGVDVICGSPGGFSLESICLYLYWDQLAYALSDKSDQLSLEKTLMLGKIEGRRRRGRRDEMVGWHHQLNGHEFEQTLGKEWRTGKSGMLQSMGSQTVRQDLATEQQNTESQVFYQPGIISASFQDPWLT